MLCIPDYRSTYGNPHMDELNGQQVAVTNVIFQYCDGVVLDEDDYLHFASQSYNNDCIRQTIKHTDDPA